MVNPAVPHLYVVAEEGGEGPVKFGINASRDSATGRPGLNSGNPRRLEVLHRQRIPLADLRWAEWLIHQRLRLYHERGEWFDVRRLVENGDWEGFVEGVLAGTADGIEEWSLRGPTGHELARMERVSEHGGPRHFRAVCECGFDMDGGPRLSMPTVQKLFAVQHLGLDPASPAVRALGRQIHHQRATDDVGGS
jgi:hypothetical protein